MKTRRVLTVLTGLAAACVLAATLAAAAGDLDRAFDGDGKTLTDFSGGSDDRAYAVATQRDGKVVVAGESRQGTDIGFAVARYRQNGTLDPSFDGDGKVRTDFGTIDSASDLAIQPDGKILVAGVVGGVNPGTSFDFAMARYNADGTLDPTFGGDGKVVTDLNGGRDFLYAVALQRDGRIILAGDSRPPGAGPNDFALARYNTDGTLDPTFDGDGKVSTPFAAGTDDTALDVAVDPAGRIVAAGWTRAGTGSQIALARYNADGSLDTGFDGDGRLVTTTGTAVYAYATGLAVQRDAKPVISLEPGFGLARFNQDGGTDTTFGNRGTVRTDFGAPGSGAQAWKVALQPDGKIVASGNTYDTRFDFAIARYTARGVLDRTFSGDGRVTSDISGSDPSIADVAYGLAIDTQGRIVLAGLSGPPGPLFEGAYDFAVARYLGAPSPCIVPNVRGKALSSARSRIRAARCGLGKVTRAFSNNVRKGRVISQRPRPGASRPNGAKVNLVVSRGRRR